MITQEHLDRLENLKAKREISGKIAKLILAEMKKTGEYPEAVIERLGLVQLDDYTGIKQIVKKYINDGRGQGKTVDGMVMELLKGKLKGKADPQTVWNLLQEAIKERYGI